MSDLREPVVLHSDGTATVPGGEGRWPLVNEQGARIGVIETVRYGTKPDGTPEYYTSIGYETHIVGYEASHLGWTLYRTEHLEREFSDAIDDRDDEAAASIEQELRRRYEQS